MEAVAAAEVTERKPDNVLEFVSCHVDAGN